MRHMVSSGIAGLICIALKSKNEFLLFVCWVDSLDIQNDQLHYAINRIPFLYANNSYSFTFLSMLPFPIFRSFSLQTWNEKTGDG